MPKKYKQLAQKGKLLAQNNERIFIDGMALCDLIADARERRNNALYDAIVNAYYYGAAVGYRQAEKAAERKKNLTDPAGL